jgi:hypothetical protein
MMTVKVLMSIQPLMMMMMNIIEDYGDRREAL